MGGGGGGGGGDLRERRDVMIEIGDAVRRDYVNKAMY